MNSAKPIANPHRRPFAANSYVLLATLLLAIIAWFISLISQAIVTAQIGNGFVGPLWFAIVLQTILIPWVLLALLSSSIHLYTPTFSTLSAIVVVFAVLGVDRNIFNPIVQSQQALSAGWLLTAIVDMVWVLYFTSSAGTVIGRALGVQHTYGNAAGTDQDIAYNGTGVGAGAGKLPGHSVQSVPTNVDAFTYPPAPHSAVSASGTGGGGGATAGTGHGTRTHSAALTDPRALSSTGTAHTAGMEGDQRTTMSEFVAASAVQSPTTEQGTQGHGGVRAGTGGEGEHVPPTAPADGTAVDGQPKPEHYPFKAEAIYPYEAKEANELTFQKGDMLEIADKNTKWWDARRADGTRGLAPSNYLRLL